MDELTGRQRRILEFIRTAVRDRGYPPTVREIGEAVGLTSSSSVHSQLANLERKGLLRKDATKPRAMALVPVPPAVPVSGSGSGSGSVQEAPGEVQHDPGVQVPLVGRIAAGTPLLATENIEDYLSVPSGFAGPGELFALRVEGQSMVGAGILDGDVVVVRRQDDASDRDIVAALLPGLAEDEATVKRLSRSRGKPMLVPENPAMEPFELGEGRIVGKVVTVLRRV
ncbi:MAG: transcriptional repressor LexA [Actinomycetota bacterium]|nr:transcriptional repressor LexA [Actinomycetota bacterium]